MCGLILCTGLCAVLKELLIVPAKSAQQGVQRTAGTLRDLQAVSWLQAFSALRLLSAPAPCPPLTRAVRRTAFL